MTLKPLTALITRNWKILKEMGILDHFTCLLRNLYAGQEVTELDMEQRTGSKLGKEYVKAVYCHPAYLTYMQIASCEMLGWMNHSWNQDCQKNINHLRYADDTTLMAESEEELKSLRKVKEESEKNGLKLNIQKTKIMVSDPITSWKKDGEKMETVTDFIFLGSKISDCSHEIKRCLLLGRVAMTKLSSQFTLRTKVWIVKAMVFPIIMYLYESWTIKKAKPQRIDAFELWCWRRFLRVPWTAKRSNQSIVKEVNPKYSLEVLML